jgi:hypothetical protein
MLTITILENMLPKLKPISKSYGALFHEDNSEDKSLDKDVILTDSDTDSERTSYSIKICGYCTQGRHSECRGAIDYPCYCSKNDHKILQPY